MLLCIIISVCAEIEILESKPKIILVQNTQRLLKITNYFAYLMATIADLSHLKNCCAQCLGMVKQLEPDKSFKVYYKHTTTATVSKLSRLCAIVLQW